MDENDSPDAAQQPEKGDSPSAGQHPSTKTPKSDPEQRINGLMSTLAAEQASETRPEPRGMRWNRN